MEIQGRVVQILEEQTGSGKNGTWRKNRFVIETGGQYPKKVCIDVWGDKFDQMNIQENAMVTAHIDVESREWQGKWFTDVKAWKVEPAEGEPQQQGQNFVNSTPPPPMNSDGVPSGPEPDEPKDFNDDLPF